MISGENKIVLDELMDCVAKGHPLLTTNASRKDIIHVVNLVNRLAKHSAEMEKELEETKKKLDKAESLNKDYLCVISYQRMLLSNIGGFDDNHPVVMDYRKLLSENKVPTTENYSEYQKRTAEFLEKKKHG